ncbi:MAG: hypothetical protein ACXAC6_03885 [Candidatus Hodarchaeales archaeon]|jgi:hypothetical protein
MDLSELVFTSLGPILYNLIFLALWLLWIEYHYKKDESRVRQLFKTYLAKDSTFYLATGLAIALFLFLLFSYAIFNTDVDDAITSGVEAFLKGHNPYQENVVEHHLPSGTTWGLYHYFPSDLISYSIFYILGGELFLPLLDTYWFVPYHLLLMIPGYWLTFKIVQWPHRRLLPFYLLLLTPFLFTNSMLMWFFFMIGYYCYEVKGYHNIGMIFYVLAASVKYLVGFIIVFYFLRTINGLIKQQKDSISFQSIRKDLSPYISGSLVLTIISLPFGLIDVIVAVFLYQGDPAYRDDVAQSVGPFLTEILKIVQLETFYLLSVTVILLIALFIIRNHTTYEKIIHISFLVMFILPFYGTELFITLPFYWWFKEVLETFPIKKIDLNK